MTGDRQAAHLIRPDTIDCATCRHRGGRDDLTADEAAHVQAAKRGRFAARAGAVIAAADDGATAITLYSGFAAKLLAGRDGRRVVTGLLFPGDFAAIDGAGEDWEGGYHATIVALTDVTWCRFADRWRAWFLDHPGVAGRLLAVEHRARTLAEERTAAMALLPAAGNLCRFLLAVFDALNARQLTRGQSFRLPLERVELARTLGLSTVHLRRVLGRLAADGVLTLSRDGRVEIVDPARARALAGGGTAAASAGPLI